MGELSVWHWLVVIAVFVLLFGARKLPDAARSLGRSARILRAELRAEEPAPAEPAPGPAAATPSGPAPASEATRPDGT
jgi:sec-independent protein translocase protein TatA